MTPPLEPPPGCVEIPGFIVPIQGYGDRPAWLTREGNVTHQWQLRGIWPTAELADAARERACEGLEE